jgi:hypothetical protein
MLMLGAVLYSHLAQHAEADQLLSAAFDILVRRATMAPTPDVPTPDATRRDHRSSPGEGGDQSSRSQLRLMHFFLDALQASSRSASKAERNHAHRHRHRHDHHHHRGRGDGPGDSRSDDNSDVSSTRPPSPNQALIGESPVTLDDDEGFLSPHALLLSATHSARSLRAMVYDCCLWRARVAGALGKTELAQQLFAFCADIAAVYWQPSQQRRRDREGIAALGALDAEKVVEEERSRRRFAARGWESGEKRTWERRLRHPAETETETDRLDAQVCRRSAGAGGPAVVARLCPRRRRLVARRSSSRSNADVACGVTCGPSHGVPDSCCCRSS